MARVLAVLLVVPALLAGCAGDEPAAAAAPEATATLHGVVVTQAIVPVAGANVTVNPGGRSAETDAKGLFEVGPLAPGSYQVTVRAAGYAPTTVQAPADGGVVKVVLEAISSDVPYIEVESYDAYLECTFDAWVSPYQILGAPCVGIVDLVTGVPVSSDRWQFQWEVSAPGLKGALAEMVWEAQPTGSQMGMLLRNVAGAGSGVDAGGTNVDVQYASTRGPSPLRMWVQQGVENPGADEGARFQDPQNQTMQYKLLLLGRADYSQPADVHLMLESRPQVFLTKFYHAMGDPSYSVVDGA
jgi:hypothetical protein